MPAAASSPIPAVLVKLGPLDTGRIADLRPCFDLVPDPRARRGRWYSLTAILLVCACAVVSGARSIDELAEWGQRASNALLAVIGIRRHLLGWRRTPSPATIGRVLGAVDGDALDRAVGAYLADRHRAAEPAPAPSASGRPRVSTAKHSRDQLVSPRRAGICSPRSLTAPS
ncbi:transposase family protein [Streptomyces sp. NPDC002730]|uniref:transposase family protein n=1 Tax=Streptomyces sp. NPDC002730 TaxID=3364662 RepID=UPI0036C14BF9